MTNIIVFYVLSAILAGWVIYMLDWRAALELSVAELIAHAFAVLCPIINAIIGVIGMVILLAQSGFLDKKVTIGRRRKA